MFKKSMPYLTVAGALLMCAALPGWSQNLPEGKGREIVANACNSCHAFAARVGSGYTPQGWPTVLRMMTNQGLNLTPDQLAVVSEYLIKNFPEKPSPRVW
jgi:virginiamycin B lyase